REFAAWPEVRWTHPDGGLYVWLTYPARVDTGPESRLMEAALREGVLYVPGRFCYVGGDNNGPVPSWGARLSFGVAPVEKIQEAIRRLARASRHHFPAPGAVEQPDLSAADEAKLDEIASN